MSRPSLLSVLCFCLVFFFLPAAHAVEKRPQVVADAGPRSPMTDGCTTAIDPTADVPAAQASPEVLAGSTWILRSWNRDEAAPVQPEVNLEYRDGRFVGSGGCNRYFTEVRSGESGGTIQVGMIGATRMACPGPADEVERRFYSLLSRVTGFRLQGDCLALLYGEGDEAGLLIFERRKK